jgi:hypothetical protein
MTNTTNNVRNSIHTTNVITLPFGEALSLVSELTTAGYRATMTPVGERNLTARVITIAPTHVIDAIREDIANGPLDVE